MVNHATTGGLRCTLERMETDPSTASDPIKRQFLFDSQFITANAAIIQESGDAQGAARER